MKSSTYTACHVGAFRVDLSQDAQYPDVYRHLFPSALKVVDDVEADSSGTVMSRYNPMTFVPSARENMHGSPFARETVHGRLNKASFSALQYSARLGCTSWALTR